MWMCFLCILVLALLGSASSFAAAVSIDCSTNPTIAQGVDFQTTDDVTLTTSGTCTLTTDQDEAGADSYVSMASLTINTDVTLTHAVSGTTASHHNEIDIRLTGNLTINGTGSINVAGKGYNGGGATGYGYTNGNLTGSGVGSFVYAGGSHGGKGGYYSGTYPTAAAYDSIVNPVLPGGGGGGNNSTNLRGMNGGGVVKITATNVTIDGSINANGETFASGYYGGGAGGTININASGTLSGTGSVTANGTYNTTSNYPGGGGGRIALYYGTDSSSFSSLLAAGGNPSNANYDGAAGTIYKKASASSYGSLTIDNNSAAQAYYTTSMDSTNDDSFSTVTIKNKATLTIDSGASAFAVTTLDVQANSSLDCNLASSLTLTTITSGSSATVDFAGNVTVTTYTDSGASNILQGTLDVTTMEATGTVTVTGAMTVVTGYTSTGATTTVTGTLTMPAFFSGTPTGTLTTNGTAYISAGSVTIPNGMTWNANGTVQKASGTSLTGMTIQSGGTLSHTVASTTADTYNKIDLTINGDLTVDSGGSVNVVGKGYNGGGNTGYGYTNGNSNSSSVGSFITAGGSHGGRGGLSTSTQVAAAYDSIVNPTLPGGGGGGNNATTLRGMNGGGVVRITATNITINGTVNANGEAFASGYYGGGAGGTIYLSASSTLSGTGSVTANGTYNTTSNYGGGGGGRIALYYATDSSSFSSLLAAGGNSGSASSDGAAGTIYKKSSSFTYGNLVINNNGATGAYYTTSLLTTIPSSDQLYNSGYAFHSVTFSNAGILNIPTAIDSVTNGGANTDRKFFANGCTADDDTLSTGEIVAEKSTYGASGITTADYTCVAAGSVGVTVAETSGSTNVIEGGATDTYTLVLNTQPTADVTVTPACSDTSLGCTISTALTFTASNWDTAQTVTVTAVNDTTYEGTHSTTASQTSSSSDTNYNGISISSVTVNITDNDTAPSIAFSTTSSSGLESVTSVNLEVSLSAAGPMRQWIMLSRLEQRRGLVPITR